MLHPADRGGSRRPASRPASSRSISARTRRRRASCGATGRRRAPTPGSRSPTPARSCRSGPTRRSSPYDPWPGLALAVRREDPRWPAGTPVFAEEQSLTLDRALRAACIDPAVSARELDRGRLTVGQRADVVVIPAAAIDEPVTPGGPLSTTAHDGPDRRRGRLRGLIEWPAVPDPRLRASRGIGGDLAEVDGARGAIARADAVGRRGSASALTTLPGRSSSRSASVNRPLKIREVDGNAWIVVGQRRPSGRAPGSRGRTRGSRPTRRGRRSRRRRARGSRGRRRSSRGPASPRAHSRGCSSRSRPRARRRRCPASRAASTRDARRTPPRGRCRSRAAAPGSRASTSSPSAIRTASSPW